MDESRDKNIRDESIMLIDVSKHDTMELVADQIYDKLTILLNYTRQKFGIQKGQTIAEPIRNYDNFKLAEDGALSYV